MNIPLFSIIIPCYNTAPYVEKCLESVVGQTYQNWEIIAVNDGSTDDTKNIILHYTENDQRIKSINQTNQGLSVARNRGIEEAKGEYILFLDSDDWYKEPSSLEHISSKIEAEDPDIIVFAFQHVMADGNLLKEDFCQSYLDQMRKPVYSGEQYLSHMLSQRAVYAWYPWRYAFKRTFWEEHHFRFRIPRFEDVDMIYKIILSAKRIGILNEIIYQYRSGRAGALTDVTLQSMRDLLCVSQNAIDDVNNMDIDEKLKVLLRSNFSYAYFNVLTRAYYLKKDDRKVIFDLLARSDNLMDYTIRKKNLFLKRMISLWGLHFTSKLLFIYVKWRSYFEN